MPGGHSGPPLRNLLLDRVGFSFGNLLRFVGVSSWFDGFLSFIPQKFSRKGESAFARNCGSCVRRAFGRVAERIAACAKARRARHLYEDETMTKPISCEPFAPAHPGRRENFARLAGIGGSERAMESMPDERACVNREFLKNTINTDKLTGLFDKFLKISDYANDCNQKSYHINLIVSH